MPACASDLFAAIKNVLYEVAGSPISGKRRKIRIPSRETMRQLGLQVSAPEQTNARKTLFQGSCTRTP
jgi:hypothetical protein